ncbi:hypothetical protein AB6806_26120 [Bosea sp. RCC_152_1]|uniref:hypothetical protein n=1 Tax=Bosea sp. RCC_152_1 TaxID=3239228 RepID=UPI0035242564
MTGDTGKVVLWCLGGLVIAFVAAAIGFSTARSIRPATSAITQSSDDAAKDASRATTFTQSKALKP